jgi:hypothetical protein
MVKVPATPKAKTTTLSITVVGGKVKSVKVPEGKVTYRQIAEKLGLTNWLFCKPDGTVLDMAQTAVEKKLIATPNVKNG